MAGSSPGTSDGGPPPGIAGKMIGAHEACPSPCTRGCAPRECTIILPTVFSLAIKYDEVGKYNYLGVYFSEDVHMRYELSMDNFVRSISKCVEVEEVSIYDHGNPRTSIETWKVLCKTLETIPSLNSLVLYGIDSSQLSISDAEAIFKVLEGHNALLKCDVTFTSESPTQATILKVLVDALLQNPILRKLSLNVVGIGQSSNLSSEVKESSGIMRVG